MILIVIVVVVFVRVVWFVDFKFSCCCCCIFYCCWCNNKNKCFMLIDLIIEAVLSVDKQYIYRFSSKGVNNK